MIPTDSSLQLRRSTISVKRQARGKFLRRLPGYTIWYVVILIGVFLSIFPYWLVLLTSFKPADQLFSGEPWSLPTAFTLQNYINVMTQYNFPGYVVHTLIYEIFSTLGQLIFSTIAAYAFARMRFPGRDLLFWLYLSTMMVPNIVTLI